LPGLKKNSPAYFFFSSAGRRFLEHSVVYMISHSQLTISCASNWS